MPGSAAESGFLRLLVAALACATFQACAFDLDPPATRVDPTIESFFGTPVEDPYRWLEQTGATETSDWFRAQNDFTRRVLDTLPGRAALRERIAALNGSDTRISELQWAGDRLFYLKRAPGEQTYKLLARDSLTGPERLLVDPGGLQRGEAPAAIDYFRASPNGKRVAFGVAQGGSEDAVLQVIDLTTGESLGPPVPRARWASPAWRFDSSILFFTQLKAPAAGSAPADLRNGSVVIQRTFEADGTTHDDPVLGPGLNPDVTIAADVTPSIETSPVSPFAIGVVQHGVQRELSLYVVRLTQLRGAATPWRKLAGPERGIVGFDLRGEWIYAVTHDEAPRYQVVRWSLNDPRPLSLANATTIAPESDRVIRGVSVAKDALYVQQQDGGYGKLLRIPFNAGPRKDAPAARVPARGASRGQPGVQQKAVAGARTGGLELPFAGAIEELVTNPLHPNALLRLAGWTEAPGYFAVDGRTGAVTRTPLLPPAHADLRGVATVQVRVRSHDGVEVPVSIVYAKGSLRDGRARVLLEAYGAYGISQEPHFSPSLLAWLEHGGVYALAHVRGGGELGRDWHRAGFKATKANSWRDVIAVAEWLVREQWTTPGRLAVSGSSAGGIAAGNAIIDRPELFAALVSIAGFHDTLRSETAMGGPTNVPEFGSVTTGQGFRDLLAMSSYARVEDDVAYPAALLTIGFRDGRVDPWDPGKMAARLQAVSTALGERGKPVLLRVDFDGGHGTSSARMADETTDLFAFLLWRTGAPDFVLP